MRDNDKMTADQYLVSRIIELEERVRQLEAELEFEENNKTVRFMFAEHYPTEGGSEYIVRLNDGKAEVEERKKIFGKIKRKTKC